MRRLPRLSARALALLVAAAVASIAFVVIARELRIGALDRLDTEVELAVHRLDSPVGDTIAVTATTIGSNWLLLPAVAVVSALALYHRRRFVAIVLVLDTVVVIAADTLLKLMFARERPRLFDKIALPVDYSFPSGHSMSAIGIWGAIAVVVSVLYPRARGAAIACAIVGIATIGLSRIYLGVHWPFDVLGGYLGGIPPLVATVYLVTPRRASPCKDPRPSIDPPR